MQKDSQMKTRRLRFIRMGTYAAWVLIALVSLLTTLLTPSAAPRATLTAADSGTSPAVIAEAQQPQGVRYKQQKVPWGSSYLSIFMRQYRKRHPNTSPYRNVAAFEQLAFNGDRRVVVTASAGPGVSKPNRHATFDIYINGNYKGSFTDDNYLTKNLPEEEKFPGEIDDSEMLLRRFFLDGAATTKFFGEPVIPATVLYGESEFSACRNCGPMIETTFKNLKLNYNIYRDKKNRGAAKATLKRTVDRWVKDGRKTRGPGQPLTSANIQQIAQRAEALVRYMFGGPCPNPESLGRPSAADGSGMELAAFSSSDPCGEADGAPGGLMKALTSGNLGGVDFSTLQMRYMSDNPDSTGLQYTFSGQEDTSEAPQDIGSALNVLTDNAADLRTWLVLNPDEFWVNLNPSEPDRIIDSQLGETNAGRELLDADFQLKRSSAMLMNPNTKLGAQYWHDLAGSSSSVCYGSRMWIVPGQVQVREDGGSLYILSAQLAMKAVPDHVADMPTSCHYDAQTDARGQRLDQAMIVPLITKMVNTAPEYAPIRRAFMARIVAQWIRDRYANGQRISFDSLIDSGNIGPAELQDGWQPQQVFNAYVKSLKDGEFTYNTTIRQGGASYIQKITVGGVDFTNLNPTVVSAAQMNQDYPQLAQTAKSSVNQLTSSDGTLWLGDTVAPPTRSLWSKVTDPVRTFASGRTGILILILAGLGVVIFGIRRGPRRGRQAT